MPRIYLRDRHKVPLRKLVNQKELSLHGALLCAEFTGAVKRATLVFFSICVTGRLEKQWHKVWFIFIWLPSSPVKTQREEIFMKMETPSKTMSSNCLKQWNKHYKGNRRFRSQELPSVLALGSSMLRKPPGCLWSPGRGSFLHSSSSED